jgi:hypothetical protein
MKDDWRHSTEGRAGVARNGLPPCFRRGARTPDLPVVESQEFHLVINLKTAKTLRLAIPPSLLMRSEEVIQ